MTVYDRQSGIEALGPPPLWACALLGIMIAAGIFALGDVAFATIISVKLIGLTAIAADAFEIIHAFRTRGWGGLHWQVILGALYLAFGLVLLTQPASGAMILFSFPTVSVWALGFPLGIDRFRMAWRGCSVRLNPCGGLRS